MFKFKYFRDRQMMMKTSLFTAALVCLLNGAAPVWATTELKLAADTASVEKSIESEVAPMLSEFAQVINRKRYDQLAPLFDQNIEIVLFEKQGNKGLDRVIYSKSRFIKAMQEGKIGLSKRGRSANYAVDVDSFDVQFGEESVTVTGFLREIFDFNDYPLSDLRFRIKVKKRAEEFKITQFFAYQ